MHRYKFSLVVCARWEETEIQEWLEYHKSAGFDHVYLYSNDDDPTSLFQTVAPYVYGPAPFVTFRHWPDKGQQIKIYLHFLKTFKHETEWFSFLDVDEFFVLKGLNDIKVFMQSYEASVDCLYFNWMIYGNMGRIKREDTGVLKSYMRRAAMPDPHTKMLCRSAVFDHVLIEQDVGLGAFWHFVDNYQIPGVRCRDVLLFPMDGYSADFPNSAIRFIEREGFAEAILERGYIAHYQFKSEADFLRRWRRGGFTNGEHFLNLYQTGEYKAVLDSGNEIYDAYLADYWYHYTAQSMCFGLRVPDPELRYQNVALNKPSWQSSVYEPVGTEPIGSRVIGGGNNGLRSGSYGFHTAYEAGPSWTVDLLALHQIDSVHIYNRRDSPEVAARATEVDVLASEDGKVWATLMSRTDQEPFGLNGAPLIVSAIQRDYRFIQIKLRVEGYLHLDEVEVYGRNGAESPSLNDISSIGTVEIVGPGEGGAAEVDAVRPMGPRDLDAMEALRREPARTGQVPAGTDLRSKPAQNLPRTWWRSWVLRGQ